MGQILEQTLHRKDMQMASKHIKIFSTSCIFREMKIKTTVRCYYIPIRVVKFQNTGYTKS